MNTQTIYDQYKKSQALAQKSSVKNAWDRLPLGTYSISRDDTIYIPNKEEWKEYYTTILEKGGFKTRIGECDHQGIGDDSQYIQIYGKHHETDMRGKGMKRLGLYRCDAEVYLATWGITKRDLVQLKPWSAHIKNICDNDSRWLGVDSDKWPKKWKQQGKNGGFTSRFLFLTGMKKDDVYSVVKKIINCE